MITQEVLLKIVRTATKAPSGHNTQPWYFTLEENGITIHPDFSRALPVVDPDNHALYISLGCALENAVLAAGQAGYKTAIELREGEEETSIHLSFILAREYSPNPLYPFIAQRQCTRREYEARNIPAEHFRNMLQAADEEGIRILLFDTPEKIELLRPFIIEGSNRQFNNPAFVNELVSWIRFNEKDAMRTGDGIYAASTGMPSIPAFLGRFFMKTFATAKSEAKRWNGLVDKTAAFALFTVKEDKPSGWIRLGRSFQRFALEATSAGISHAHVNMPCEEAEVGQKMMEAMGLTRQKPLLLIRLGYAKSMPYSFRKGLEKIIVN